MSVLPLLQELSGLSRDQGSWLLLHHVPAGFVLCVGKQIPPGLGRYAARKQDLAFSCLSSTAGPMYINPNRSCFSFSLAQRLQTTTSAHLIRNDLWGWLPWTVIPPCQRSFFNPEVFSCWVFSLDGYILPGLVIKIALLSFLPEEFDLSVFFLAFLHSQ